MDGVQVQEFVLVIMDGQAPDVQQVFINAYRVSDQTSDTS